MGRSTHAEKEVGYGLLRDRGYTHTSKNKQTRRTAYDRGGGRTRQKSETIHYPSSAWAVSRAGLHIIVIGAVVNGICALGGDSVDGIEGDEDGSDSGQQHPGASEGECGLDGPGYEHSEHGKFPLILN